MDIVGISEWLKDTIPGVVILGAFGSILAAFILWLAKKYIYPIFRNFLSTVFSKILGHFIAPAARQLIKLHLDESENKVYAFYALQIMKLAFSLFFATCSFFLFAFALYSGEQTLYRASLLVPLIITFLSLWYALRCLAVALIPAYVDVDKMIHEEAERAFKAKNS